MCTHTHTHTHTHIYIHTHTNIDKAYQPIPQKVLIKHTRKNLISQLSLKVKLRTNIWGFNSERRLLLNVLCKL